MKKLIGRFITMSVACSLLVACAEDDANTEVTNEAIAEEENTEVELGDVSTEADLDAEEILLQSTEAMNQLKSYSAEIEMRMTIGENGQENTMESFAKSDVLLDPLSISQTMTDASGNEQSQQYMDENGTTYIFEPLEGKWFKIENSDMDIAMEVSPQEQLEMILEISDEITVEEEDNHYVLTVVGSGDELLDITKKLTQMDEEIPYEFLEEMNVNIFNYVTYINKDTFLQDRMSVKIEMELTIKIGEETQTSVHLQETNTTYTSFDEIDKITIPQEALDYAEEINLDNVFQEMEDLESELEQQSEELDKLLEELKENLDQ